MSPSAFKALTAKRLKADLTRAAQLTAQLEMEIRKTPRKGGAKKLKAQPSSFLDIDLENTQTVL